jgi:hypothetical protein
VLNDSENSLSEPIIIDRIIFAEKSPPLTLDREVQVEPTTREASCQTAIDKDLIETILKDY